MKKATSKALAIGLTVLLGLSIITGCGAKTADSTPAAPAAPAESAPAPQAEEPEPEDIPEEEFEDFEEEEIPEDFDEAEEEFDEGFDEGFNKDAEEPAEESAEEPAEGLSDQVLMTGYYGAWDGDTQYIFGVLSDKDFMINVVGASHPILYADGEYKDNGDGTYTATITETDNAFAEGQTLLIKAEGGPDITISSENPEVNDAANGSYTYAGEKASDVESLK